jgi:hypothetical protein
MYLIENFTDLRVLRNCKVQLKLRDEGVPKGSESPLLEKTTQCYESRAVGDVLESLLLLNDIRSGNYYLATYVIEPLETDRYSKPEDLVTLVVYDYDDPTLYNSRKLPVPKKERIEKCEAALRNYESSVRRLKRCMVSMHDDEVRSAVRLIQMENQTSSVWTEAAIGSVIPVKMLEGESDA